MNEIFSMEAEQAVIGGILLQNNVIETVNFLLDKDDFFKKEHSIIFEKANEIFKKNISVDALTLLQFLKEDDQIKQAGGEEYLLHLCTAIPSIANIESYSKIVREKSIRRKISNIYSNAIDKIKKNKNIEDVLNSLQNEIFSLKIEKSEIGAIKSSETMHGIFEEISSGERKSGTLTYFKNLDHLSGGFQNTDLIIIGARPSIGKTSFAINIAENMATYYEKPVLIFSLEMSKEQLNLRMISNGSDIEYNKIKSNELSEEEIIKIGKTVCEKKYTNIIIDDESIMTPSMLKIKARKEFKKNRGLSIIIIDYLQKLYDPSFKNNKVQEVTYIVSSIKSLAKELNIPIIALSQLSRSLESRADKRPILSDLRESGGIEQEADFVMFLYRDEVYNEQTYAKGICEINIAKNRNGKTGSFTLKFVPQFTRFENI